MAAAGRTAVSSVRAGQPRLRARRRAPAPAATSPATRQGGDGQRQRAVVDQAGGAAGDAGRRGVRTADRLDGELVAGVLRAPRVDDGRRCPRRGSRSAGPIATVLGAGEDDVGADRAGGHGQRWPRSGWSARGATTVPPARTSTAGAAAVCRTVTRAWPAGNGGDVVDERRQRRRAVRGRGGRRRWRSRRRARSTPSAEQPAGSPTGSAASAGIEGQVVGAGGQLERVGQRARLEVVDQLARRWRRRRPGCPGRRAGSRRWRCRPPWPGWRGEPARRRRRRHRRRGGTCGSSSRGVPFRGGTACHPSFRAPPRVRMHRPRPTSAGQDWAGDQRHATATPRAAPATPGPATRSAGRCPTAPSARSGRPEGVVRPPGAVARRGAGAARRRPAVPRARGARGRVEVRARGRAASCGAGWPSSPSG